MSKVEWMRLRYANDQLHRETPYLNQQEHGVEKWYYEDGQLSSETRWVNGKRHGVDKMYCIDGQLLRETLWIRGIQRDDLLGDKHKLTRLVLLGDDRDKVNE